MKNSSNRSFELCQETARELYDIERKLFSLVVSSRKRGIDKMLLKSLQGVLYCCRSCIALLLQTGRLSNLLENII